MQKSLLTQKSGSKSEKYMGSDIDQILSFKARSLAMLQRKDAAWVNVSVECGSLPVFSNNCTAKEE